MWHGFPVFLIGVVDMKRKFHPTSLSICCNEEAKDNEFIFRTLKSVIEKLFTVIYNPNILIADGAAAITNGFVKVFDPPCLIRIMCWVHMLRNVDKRLNGDLSSFKDAILADIKTLQKSISTAHFQYSSNLFLEKWRAKNIQPLNDFLCYFETEWLLSSNSGWYEGMYDRTTKQNNGLEATNNVIKTHHTLRSRLSLNHYLNNAVNMLKEWSIDRNRKENIFSETFDIDCYYSYAYKWAKNGNILLRVMNTSNFIVCKKDYEHLIPSFQNFISNVLTFDFDTLKDIVMNVFYVILNQDDWRFSTCSCPFYQKNYSCGHIINIAVSLNLTKYPSYCKNLLLIGDKPKRGRIPNALKALQKQ